MVDITGLLIVNMLVPTTLVIACWAFALHTFITIYKHWNTNFKKRKVTSILTIISTFFFATCMIWCTVHVFNPFAKDPASYEKTALYGAYLTFSIGRSFMFLLFLGLIHYTFQSTKYDYNKWIKIVYLIPSVIVPIILIIMITIEFWVVFNLKAFKIRRYLDHANTITLCLFSTFLFCRVLGRVAWRQVRSEGSDDIEGLKSTTRLLHTITKYTILVLVIIFFAICVIIMDELTWQGITFGMSFDKWFLIVFILYYIDCFVNIFCVYLRFAFADPIYDKICLCAHSCCMKAVLSCIKWKYKEYAEEQKRNTIQLSVATHAKSDANTDPHRTLEPNSQAAANVPSTVSHNGSFLSPNALKSCEPIMSDSEQPMH